MPGAKALAWLDRLIWTLIYGGLLVLVVGLKTEDASAATGWSMIVAGGTAAALGFFLIWVRSRIPESTMQDPEEKNR